MVPEQLHREIRSREDSSPDRRQFYAHTSGLGVPLMIIADESYPTRSPVWWARRGAAGPHPEGTGATGRQVVIRIPKSLSGIEAVLSRLLRAPNEVRRPMDDMNSVLWELMDGTLQLEKITRLMDLTFHERIATADERIRASIGKLVADGLAVVRQSPFRGEWNVSSLHDPSGMLNAPSARLGLDTEE